MRKRAFDGALVLGFLLTCNVSPAAAWGKQGHCMVAAIAERNLSDKARAKIADLVNAGTIADTKSISDLAFANFADSYREQHPESGTWHFVNIPITSTKEQAKSFTDDPNCVVGRIGFLQDQVSNHGGGDNPEQTLAFLVHFLGDIHQPLHCAVRKDSHGVPDKGGNLVHVDYPGANGVKLHAIWDDNLLWTSMSSQDMDPNTADMQKWRQQILDYAKKLNDDFADQKAAWQAGAPADWAWDSLQLARDISYKGIPADKPPAGEPLPSISQDYIKEARPVIDQQLAKAGFRLAKVLNDLYGQ